MMPPASVIRSIFWMCIRLNGVSRVTRISFLRSLSITSAARVIRESDMPLAIRPKVPHEHGHTINAEYVELPDANGAAKVLLGYIFIFSFWWSGVGVSVL